MKKIIFALIAFVFAAPALATVTITATDEGGGIVRISYTAVSEPNKIRAFALNITVDSGATIDGISDYNIGESNSTAKGYGIFMGAINIDAGTGQVISYGTPVAPNTASGALGGLGTPGITVEFGSLYEDGNAPPDSGTLCRLDVNGQGAADYNLGLATEDVRGGVVMEDGSTVTPIFIIRPEECFPSGHPDYSEWVAVGKPDCWCYPRQCHGDADGQKEGILITRWVSFNDLNIFIIEWQTDDLCSDFDHREEGAIIKRRVSFNDLAILVANWQTDPIDPNCLDVP